MPCRGFRVARIPSLCSRIIPHIWPCWGVVRESQGQDKYKEEGVRGCGEGNFSPLHRITLYREATKQDLGMPEVRKRGRQSLKLKS